MAVMGAKKRVVRKSSAGVFVPTDATLGGGASPAVRPPVGAPPSPTATVPNTLPPDPNYDQTIGALQRGRDTSLAGLQQQRQQGLLNYGYTQGQDGSLAFDANNPFSQAAMLKRNYDRSRTGNENSYAARGLGYSGALANAQHYATEREQQGNDALQKQMLAFLANNAQGQAQAGTSYEMGAAQAGADRVQNAASSPLYAPVSPAAAKDYTDKPGTDSRGNPGIWRTHNDGRRVFMRRG